MNVGLKTHESPNLTMLTYPRSGKHWLYWCIKTNTDLKMRFLHHTKSEIKKEYYKEIISYPIITVVRRPEECLASINTMENNAMFNFRLNEYIEHYKFVLKNADLFFDYQDIKEKTPKIVSIICKKYGGNILNNDYNFENYEKWYIETQNSLKLITSKNSKNYNNFLSYAKSIDLSEHTALYLKAKSKCIIV
jgi:hypothetical protein